MLSVSKNPKNAVDLAAAYSGNLDIVKVLIDKGLDIDAENKNEATPLYFAVTCKHLNVVKFLVETRANVNVKVSLKRSDPFTLLHLASQHGLVEIVDVFLEAKCNVNDQDAKKKTPLHLAAKEGHDQIVTALLKHGANVHVRDSENATALHTAVQNCHLTIAKTLINNGADINAKMENNITPIHLGAEAGSLDIVKFLLINGAFFDAKSNLDKCALPLNLSEDKNHLEIIEIFELIENLFRATRDNNDLEVENCLKRGALVNSRSIHFETPLLYASWKGYINIVDLLLKYGANVNFTNKNNLTPLHYAAKFNHLEIIYSLLKHGAMFDIVSSKGDKRPIDFAVDAKNTDIIILFKLIDRLFEEAKNGNYKLVAELEMIRDKNPNEFLSIMNTCNNKKQTIIQIALTTNHQDLANSLTKMLQEDKDSNISELETKFDCVTTLEHSSVPSNSSL